MEREKSVIEHEVKELQKWDLFDEDARALVGHSFIEGMKYPDGMSDFQIEHFVVGQKQDSSEYFATASSKFWYCRLELRNLSGSLLNSRLSYDTLMAEIQKIEGEIEVWESKWFVNRKVREGNIRMREIEIKQKEFSIAMINKSVNDQLRMMATFSRQLNKWGKLRENNSDSKEEDELAVWQMRARNDPKLQGKVPGTEKPLPLHIENLLKKDFTK